MYYIRTKMRIARASSRMVAYDHGYLYEFGTTTILRWDKDITQAIQKGVNSSSIGLNKYKQKEKYVDQIESTDPGYLHFLYRSATNNQGIKSGFADLALVMNRKSTPPPPRIMPIIVSQ